MHANERSVSMGDKPADNQPNHRARRGLIFSIANPIMKAILRSPFAGPLAEEIMVLTFTGRKSGKKFSTPVGFVRNGDHLIVFNHSNWWKNFIGGAPVSMTIKGKEVTGTATLVTDLQAIKQMIVDLNAAHPPQRARQLGFYTESPDPSAEEVLEISKGMTFIDILLNEG